MMPDRFSLGQSQGGVFMSGKVQAGKQAVPTKRVLHIVRLSAEERTGLQRMIDQGKRAGSVLKKVWILPKADQGEGGPA
jgi:hypothetical protein